MTEEEQIAKNIKEAIRTSGMSVIQVADELKVHNTQIYAYMKAKYLPGAVMIKRLCAVLGCEYEEILGHRRDK